MITHTAKGTDRKPLPTSWQSPEVYILSLSLLSGTKDFHNSADRRETM